MTDTPIMVTVWGCPQCGFLNDSKAIVERHIEKRQHTTHIWRDEVCLLCGITLEEVSDD
jgi:hypothetical protein